MSPLRMQSYRLVEPTRQDIVWIPDVSTPKSRLSASRLLAHRMGYPILSILDSEVGNEYVIARKDKPIARLITMPRWS